jgi:hypothetical protein
MKKKPSTFAELRRNAKDKRKIAVPEFELIDGPEPSWTCKWAGATVTLSLSTLAEIKQSISLDISRQASKTTTHRSIISTIGGNDFEGLSVYVERKL